MISESGYRSSLVGTSNSRSFTGSEVQDDRKTLVLHTGDQGMDWQDVLNISDAVLASILDLLDSGESIEFTSDEIAATVARNDGQQGSSDLQKKLREFLWNRTTTVLGIER